MIQSNKNNKIKVDLIRKSKVELCDEYEIVVNGMPKIYTIIKEVDLTKVHPKFYMEDWDEEKDHWNAPED